MLKTQGKEDSGRGLSAIDEGELVRRCRVGDELAFEELYRRYRLPLYSYIHKLLPEQSSQVDDIFQQVWCRALRNWARYSDQQRLLAWLCRIAHNLVMDLHRRSRHLASEALEEQDAASEELRASESLEQDELHQALEAAICRLPPEQRQVVEFRRRGRSFREIAEEQGISLNTVLGRMHYAVLKLRGQLRDYL
ncbi:MAG: RNA polymerase sigma factor [Oligosphaeraceae bacterium]